VSHTKRKYVIISGIPYAVIATKIDKVYGDPTDAVPVSDIETGDVVNTLHAMYGVPRHNIMPVKNYEVERTTEPSVNVLALKALKKLLQLARDQQGRQSDDAVGGAKRDPETTDMSEMA